MSRISTNTWPQDFILQLIEGIASIKFISSSYFITHIRLSFNHLTDTRFQLNSYVQLESRFQSYFTALVHLQQKSNWWQRYNFEQWALSKNCQRARYLSQSSKMSMQNQKVPKAKIYRISVVEHVATRWPVCY